MFSGIPTGSYKAAVIAVAVAALVGGIYWGVGSRLEESEEPSFQTDIDNPWLSMTPIAATWEAEAEAAPTSGSGSAFSGTMLTVSNRSNFSVCVDGGAEYIITTADVEKVRQAIDDGLASVISNYASASGYREGAKVSTGCPPPTAALTVEELTERPYAQRYSDLLGYPVRDFSQGSPSLHRVFVYVITPDTFSLAFGSKPYARGPAEMLCAGHNCAEVTTGLYVTPSVPLAVLSEGILDVIGFLPSASQGDPPTDPEEAERLREAELELRPQGTPPLPAPAAPYTPGPTCPPNPTNHLNIELFRQQPGMEGAVITEIDNSTIQVIVQGVELTIMGIGKVIGIGGPGDPSRELSEQLSRAIDAANVRC